MELNIGLFTEIVKYIDLDTIKLMCCKKYNGYQNNIAVDYAASNGHINVLEWFHMNGRFNKRGETSGNSDYELKYSIFAINCAAKKWSYKRIRIVL
jgi:hypothetical protein